MSDDGRQGWLRGHPMLNRMLLYAVITGIILCVGMVAADHLLNNLFGTHTEPVDMATVSRWTNVKFPPNAKLLNSLGIRHGIDYELYAEVEMNRRDVEPFVAAVKKELNVLLSRKDRMNLTNSIRNWRKDTPIPEWWKPDSARKFISCYTHLPLLLISLDNPDKATVWVHIDSDGPPPIR